MVLLCCEIPSAIDLACLQLYFSFFNSKTVSFAKLVLHSALISYFVFNLLSFFFLFFCSLSYTNYFSLSFCSPNGAYSSGFKPITHQVI